MKVRLSIAFVFLTGMALLALLVLGVALHSTAHAGPKSPSPEAVIDFPGNSGPLDTGVSVHSNDLIRIHATGVVFNNMMYFDADGGLLPGSEDVILPSIATNSLVGSIGDFGTGTLLDDGADVNPRGISGSELGYPGIFGPGYVGSSFEGTAAADGNIYLAFNDYPLHDNVGYFHVSIVVSPTGTITKSVDNLFAVPSERRTYQIVISPERDIVAARLTDTLPSAVTWAGDLSATGGNASYSDGTLIWSSPLTASESITITYGVTVTHAPCCGTAAHTDIYTDVYNDAVMDDGQGNVFHSTPAILTIGYPFGTGSDRTFDLAFGDADNDGDLDLAVGNHGLNQVCWNNGDGTFDCEDAFGGSATFDVEWGDMNGDGYLDVVVANSMAHANLVCLNNRDRTFTCTAFIYCSGPGPNEICHVALGDVDCDSDLDIILGTRYPGNVWEPDVIYYNDGDGITYTITKTACQGHPTLDLDLGDVDNDGDLDLVVVGHYSEYVCINHGSCTGIFTETRWLSSPRFEENTSSVALGDADRDGDLDVAVGRETHFNEVYLNDGSGNFPERFPFDPIWEKTWDVAWGNVDCDGDLDIALGNSYRPTVIYFNEPMTATSNFTLTKPVLLGTSSSRTHSVAFGDVNGDGHLDLAVGNNWEQNVIYINTLVRCVYLPIVMKSHPWPYSYHES